MEQFSFGYWLRLKRKALDLTREQLAERVGYSAATIRKIEDEERHPSAQVVERLAEVFNVPSDERTAFLHFARGDWKSVPSQSVEDIPWRASPKSTPSNLPATATSLIGREKEIADIHTYLLKADVRLVTLIGPPGIGKTRLSIQSSRATIQDFPDGVFFVALAPLDDRALIGVTVAQALHYVGARNISTHQQLKEGIGEKQILIVLDNCEHLIEDIAPLVSDLLSACSRLKVLATSRESLRVPGEWLYPVPTLDVPNETLVDIEAASKFPALTLFAERARAVRPDFALSLENFQAVSSICAQLDGLPLAIELIAARMRLMSPQALLERLNDQFILSADGMRAPSARQKTLNDAIGWSYNLLSAEEQKLFAYLSVFSGGFALDAVEVMFSQKVTEKPLPNLISLLLDKSLLKLGSNLEASGEVRFTMLATIQEYARERLREMKEETEIRNDHLRYFLDLAEKADKELRGHHQLEWLIRFHSDRDNLRAALDWAIETKQTEKALRIARKLHWFFFVRGEHTEGRQGLGRVLALPDAPLYPESYAEVLTQIAHHTWLQSGAKEAKPFVEKALAVAREHGDKRNIAKALSILGLVMNLEHNFAAAQVALEESKTLFEEVDDDWGYAHALMCLGSSAYLQRDDPNTLSLHQQALELFRKLGDLYFQSVALRLMSDVQVRQGNWSLAQTALREALTLAQQLNSKYEIGSCLWSLGYAVQPTGNVERAVHLYGAAKNIMDSVGAWSKDNVSAFENDIAPCRAALSESEFSEAMEEGHAMTMEQAIAYALENSNE